jgi:hypothetical protein
MGAYPIPASWKAGAHDTQSRSRRRWIRSPIGASCGSLGIIQLVDRAPRQSGGASIGEHWRSPFVQATIASFFVPVARIIGRLAHSPRTRMAMNW